MTRLDMKEIRFYDFDIDTIPKQRWDPIMKDFKDHIPMLKKKVKQILSGFGFGFGVKFAKIIYQHTNKQNIMYYQELNYLADTIGLEPHEIILMQLIYETSSACTSAVISYGDRELYFRTMDWPMEFLRDITIGLNVIRNGKIIGRATTWLGYIGFLTATNTESNYTIAINYRSTKSMNIKNLLINLKRTCGMKWPIGYLVRYIMETNMVVDEAKKLLLDAKLISPCYITLYVPDGKTTIITRDADKTVYSRTNGLVQTNCDWNKTDTNILWSIERIAHINKVQQRVHGMKGLGSKEILKMLLEHPVYNSQTIYVHYQYGNEFKTLV